MSLLSIALCSPDLWRSSVAARPGLTWDLSQVLRRGLPGNSHGGVKFLTAKRVARLRLISGLARVDNSSGVRVGRDLVRSVAVPPQDETAAGARDWRDPIQYDKTGPPTTVLAPGRRIIAIGDVHGDLARTEWALQLAGVLSSDGYGRWIGGTTVCIQLGDILDRGEDEIAIMSLLDNLANQARRKGGAVFQINGNHETMNVEGDFRFVEPGGFVEAQNFSNYCEEEHGGDYDTAFSQWYSVSQTRKDIRTRPLMVSWILNPVQMQRRAAARTLLFSPGGFLAQKLSQHGVVLKVNSWLFVHGGLLPHHVKYGLERLNKEVSGWMYGGGGLKPPFMAVRGYDSIVWSRLYSRDAYNSMQDKINACGVLEATLEAVGASALVVGHTPQPYGANCECRGQVWRIDVGMSKGVLNADPEVLEINGSEARILAAEYREEENSSILA